MLKRLALSLLLLLGLAPLLFRGFQLLLEAFVGFGALGLSLHFELGGAP